MKTINKNIVNEYAINKSRFICCLYKIDNSDSIENIINDVKKIYKGADHYCYSYIIDNIKRFNDDGEPSGTAGMPILNVLEKNDLNNILCIVIRYFGGIKLGAGGLVRAYTNSVVEALANSEIKEITYGKKLELTFNYSNVKTINNLLVNADIITRSFNNDIIYNVNISNDEYRAIYDDLKYLCDIKEIDEIVM